jgi:hypothetical protein
VRGVGGDLTWASLTSVILIDVAKVEIGIERRCATS